MRKCVCLPPHTRTHTLAVTHTHTHSFRLLFTLQKYCFTPVPLSQHWIAKCQEEKQCPNAPNVTIDARAIRKFSGMLKRMQMHTMP